MRKRNWRVGTLRPGDYVESIATGRARRVKDITRSFVVLARVGGGPDVIYTWGEIAKYYRRMPLRRYT